MGVPAHQGEEETCKDADSMNGECVEEEYYDLGDTVKQRNASIR